MGRHATCMDFSFRFIGRAEAAQRHPPAGLQLHGTPFEALLPSGKRVLLFLSLALFLFAVVHCHLKSAF